MRKDIQAKHISKEYLFDVTRQVIASEGYATALSVSIVMGLPHKVVYAKCLRLDSAGLIWADPIIIYEDHGILLRPWVNKVFS